MQDLESGKAQGDNAPTTQKQTDPTTPADETTGKATKDHPSAHPLPNHDSSDTEGDSSP